MKNLIVSSLTLSKINSNNILKYCIACDKLFLLKENSIFNEDFDLICDLNEILLDADQTASDAVFMEFCSLTGMLVVGFASGQLFEVNTEEFGVGNFAGCIEPGIVTAAWAPGEDFLAIVSSASSLFIFGSDISEPMSETDLTGENEEKSVSVGWGKKETQFRGKEGKLTASAINTSLPTLAYDDGKVRMSWRGDGECLAVSLLIDTKRFIQVINKEGVLLHTSEPIPGLESALAWRPSGNIIASSERLPNKHLISFFEKNTLPHGGFSLVGNWNVREILWSSDSSILATILDGEQTMIRLYTTGNFHWYHKYSIPIKRDHEIGWVSWDKVESGLLHLITVSAEETIHYKYSFRQSVETSSGYCSSDRALAAVIDGSRLLLTAFSSGIVPPPMSTSTIDAPSPINAVTFSQYGSEASSNDFLLQLVDGTTLVYKYNEETSKHAVLKEYIVPEVFRLFWVSSEVILGLRSGNKELIVGRMKDNDLDTSLKELDASILEVKRLPGQRKVLVSTNLPKFLVLDLETLEMSPSDIECPPKCGKPLQLENRIRNDGSLVTLMLDNAHRLYICPTQIANNVTSMRIHQDMLLVTTLQHKLLCWPLDVLMASPAERAVERGARIVTAVPGGSKVVLQLPRGNLEVIQPRALSLATLKKELSALRYSEAYTMMRRERINLNLFYDHDPQLFIANIDHFIAMIRDPVLLYTFIAELSPEDVSKSMYSAFYSHESTENNPNKVKQACKFILEAIKRRSDQDHYLLPALSCLVKIGATEEALLTIIVIPDQTRKLEGLKHVMYLVDIDQLFKVALGTYNFDLVMFIAGKSQKDPKEYLPFIAQLKAMEENYRQFTINKYLKRYEQAVFHLARCPDRLQECLEFIVTHSLYAPGLRLFPNGTDGFKSVCVKYAEDLTRQKRHAEAGILYLRAGQHNLALFAFTRSGDWRQVMTCARALSYSEQQHTDLVNSLADSLRTERRYEEAARLLIDHGNDLATGIAALCSAQMFDEASRVARLHGQSDLINSVIKPSALSTCTTLLDTITRNDDSIRQQVNRLEEVRKHRQDVGEEIDWDDAQSYSSRGSSSGSRSSQGSSASSASRRSAKNARKLERKLVSLKKGGPFEDVALMASLHDLISQVVALKTNVMNVNFILMTLEELTPAAQLQREYKRLLSTIEKVVPDVWCGEGSGEGDEFGSHATANSIAAAFSKEAKKLPPQVKALQPKILIPPDLLVGFQWEFSILNF